MGRRIATAPSSPPPNGGVYCSRELCLAGMNALSSGDPDVMR